MRGPHIEQMDTQIKRYVVVSCDTYYPLGGTEDFVSFHSTKEEAEQAAELHKLKTRNSYTGVEDLLDIQNKLGQ